MNKYGRSITVGKKLQYRTYMNNYMNTWLKVRKPAFVSFVSIQQSHPFNIKDLLMVPNMWFHPRPNQVLNIRGNGLKKHHPQLSSIWGYSNSSISKSASTTPQNRRRCRRRCTMRWLAPHFARPVAMAMAQVAMAMVPWPWGTPGIDMITTITIIIIW